MSLVMESCGLNELCEALGQTEKLLNELREKLQQWLKLQPHLPQDIPEQTLNHFLIGTKLSLEQAKHKIDMFYTMKKLVPELFFGRDPRGTILTRLQELSQNVCLPKLGPQNNRVFILRPSNKDYSQISGYDCFKYIVMMEELLMIEAQYSLGSIYVFDHAALTLPFVAKFTPTVVKKTEVAITEGLARRLAGIHFLNAAPITERVLSLAKKVLKPKLAARIHTHSKGSYETFHKLIPRSILPKDYGGDEPSMNDMSKLWFEKMTEKRTWFLEQEKIFANERLRPGSAVNGDDLFGFSGSFRRLEVD